MGGGTAPLSVLVVGAGIGGLTAALELRAHGHEVTILEQSRFANEYGAAIHLAPNANGLLRRLGIDLTEDGGVATQSIREAGRDGTIKKTIPIWRSASMWQAGWLFCHRRTLHERLKREALSETRAGPVIKLATSCRVKSVNPAAGEVELAVANDDGDWLLRADVVIGADGVHSAVRASLHPEAKTRSSGKNAYRFLLQKTELEASVSAAAYDLVKDNGVLTQFYDLDRRVVVFPADHDEWLNLVCMHPEQLSDPNEENLDGWGQGGDKTRMLEIYKEFGDSVREVLAAAPVDSVRAWKLLDMDPLPSWTAGKTCLLGDAAHPFLPYNGQGGACAIEDAASLGVMLGPGVSAAEVPARLRLYETARKNRAYELQHYSRTAGLDLRPDAMDMVGHTMAKLAAFAYGHDEFHHSTHLLQEHLLSTSQRQAKDPNAVPLLWRAPVGFGIVPGPRQAPDGSRWPSPNNTPFRSIAVRMRTSRTLLQNLLPRRDLLAFDSPASVAEVTWKFQRNENVPWLGGRAYSHFSLYMHDVRCWKESNTTGKSSDDNGQVVRDSGAAPSPSDYRLVGDYLALMLEDRADPVITGRDELGFPKLACDLAMTETETQEERSPLNSSTGTGNNDSSSSTSQHKPSTLSTKIQASFDGHVFATLSVQDAQFQTAKPAPASAPAPTPASRQQWQKPKKPHAGILVHRYVPAVGRPGEADADYMVCVPPPPPPPAGKDESNASKGAGTGEEKNAKERVWSSKKADMVFDAGDWTSLPLLHGIVQRLAELPNLGIVEARITEGKGVGNHETAYRVD